MIQAAAPGGSAAPDCVTEPQSGPASPAAATAAERYAAHSERELPAAVRIRCEQPGILAAVDDADHAGIDPGFGIAFDDPQASLQRQFERI